MLLGMTATTLAACFCLWPAPVPEQVPVAPDALSTPVAAPLDAIPERCLTGARAWARTLPACPRMPSELLTTERARPLLLGRAW